MRATERAARGPLLSSLLVVLVVAGGCSTYDASLREARRHFYAGEHELALHSLDVVLEDPNFQNSPDRPLYQLERAMIYMAMGSWDLASRDLEEADQFLEVLDFTRDFTEIGKYFVRDKSGIYRAPPYEKFFLPTLNLLSHAAKGDLESARTEGNLAYARLDGYTTLENSTQYDSPAAYLLIGLTDELNGDARQAEMAYERANQQLVSMGTPGSSFALRDPPAPEGQGELILTVLAGRAPIWVETDGQTAGVAGQQLKNTIDQVVEAVLSQEPEDKRRKVKTDLAGGMPHIRLKSVRRQGPRIAGGSFTVAGQSEQLHKVLDLEAQVLAWYDQVKTKVLMAALGRMAVRLAARVATQKSLEEQEDVDEGFAKFVGQMVELAMYAADTRCWNLLPGAVLFDRVCLPAGQHTLVLTLRTAKGGTRTIERQVEVEPGRASFEVVVAP